MITGVILLKGQPPNPVSRTRTATVILSVEEARTLAVQLEAITTNASDDSGILVLFEDADTST